VELLKLEISALQESLSAAPHSKSPHQEGQPQRSYTTAAGSGELSDKSTVQALHVTASGTSMPKSSTAVQSHYRQDRKFNVIVYGIQECPKGTPKHARSESDLKSVISVLSKVDNSVKSQSIKDVYHLGRLILTLNTPDQFLFSSYRSC